MAAIRAGRFGVDVASGVGIGNDEGVEVEVETGVTVGGREKRDRMNGVT